MVKMLWLVDGAMAWAAIEFWRGLGLAGHIQ